MASKKQKQSDDIVISFIDSFSSEDVTGSAVYVKTKNYQLLLDCGMHQTNSKKDDYLANARKPKEFKEKDLDFIFISHLHQDHVGLCPKYYKNGFRGATIVPKGSLSIMRRMAQDCANISERDVELINNQEGKNYKPLFDMGDVNTMMEYTIEKPIGEKIFINEEISFMFIPSGHLLNSCQIVLYITVNNITKVIGYTGDLGNSELHNKYVGKFEPITQYCDVVLTEGTYGDRSDLKIRDKERKNDLGKLKSIIDTQVIEMKGRLIIPVFAQSRSAQMLNFIYQMYKNDESFKTKVYLDSPLAIDILKEYENLLEGEELEDFKNMLKWDNLMLIKESEDSKALVSSQESCVILSTAGMMQVGRIRHHFKSIVSNPNATILFCGYSTDGSLSSMLRDNKRKNIDVDGVTYKIRCAAFSLKSMSGHMMFNQMIQYYSDLNCGKIVIHHASQSAKETLASALKKELEKKCKSTRVIISNSSLKIKL